MKRSYDYTKLENLILTTWKKWIAKEGITPTFDNPKEESLKWIAEELEISPLRLKKVISSGCGMNSDLYMSLANYFEICDPRDFKLYFCSERIIPIEERIISVQDNVISLNFAK